MPTAQFLIRVESRDATLDDAGWAALDEVLTGAGFRRWVGGADGTTYFLPVGMYHLAWPGKPCDVLSQARRATSLAGVRCSVVVVEAAAIIWMGLDRVPEGQPCD